MSLRRSLHFTRMFLSRPGEIGAITPSSPSLSREMFADIDLVNGESLVEFGPGTGALTSVVASLHLEPHCYLGIEINPTFVSLLRKRFTNLHFVEGSAEDADRLCREAGLLNVRAIVSGLPFACLPQRVQDGVIDAVDQMMPSGAGVEFRTFQYLHSYRLPAAVRFRRMMSQRFGKMQRRGPIFMNLPPAYVLCWTRQ